MIRELPENYQVDEETGELIIPESKDIKEQANKLLTVVNAINHDIDVIDAEIKRLQARKKTMSNNITGIHSYLRENMQQSGIDKITCPLFTVTLKKPSKVCVIDSLELLPDEYVNVVTDVKPDKRKILAAQKEGEDIPGAHMEDSQRAVMIK